MTRALTIVIWGAVTLAQPALADQLWLDCQMVGRMSPDDGERMPPKHQTMIVDETARKLLSYDTRHSTTHVWQRTEYGPEKVAGYDLNDKGEVRASIDRRSLAFKGDVWDKAKDRRVILEGSCEKINPMPIQGRQL